MKVLGFDIDEASGRSACGTVCVLTPSHRNSSYQVHVYMGPVKVQGFGATMSLAEGRASIEVAKVAEESAKLVAMCPPWPDDFPLCESCQEQESELDMMWCKGCIQKMSIGCWVSPPSETP